MIIYKKVCALFVFWKKKQTNKKQTINEITSII